MGTGASNQVRSGIESAKEAAAGVSFSICSSNIQQMGSDNAFPTSTNNDVSTKREMPVSHKIKSKKKSQKSEVRNLPSPSLCARRNSQEEADNAVQNVSRQDLHEKIKELESALAVSESHKLDLQDQVQALEAHSAQSTILTDNLLKTLNSRDQHITMLEEDSKNSQTEFQKKALKYKKRIRGLTKQVFELRHEMSITQMELKAQILQQNETYMLSAPASSRDRMASYSEGVSDNSRTLIIVELSNQISEQEEQITILTTEVADKTQQIKMLKAAFKEARKPESTTVPSPRHLENVNNDTRSMTKRNRFSRETFESFPNNTMQTSTFNPTTNGTSTFTKTKRNSYSGAHHKPAFNHSTTAISDSDSDWSDGPSLPAIQRHSAPPQSRKKSSVSEPYHRNAKSKCTNLQSGDECSNDPFETLNNY